MNDDEARLLADLIQKRVDAAQLSLDGDVVVTEAATGAYASTAVAIALSGGVVWAFANETEFGSRDDALADVSRVAQVLGVSRAVRFVERRSELPFDHADIITNSGVLRPISDMDLRRMKQGAVVALMYEAWEARTTDIDFDSALDHGVEVVGVNEGHPFCGAFDSLGPVVIAALQRRAWMDNHPRIGVLSDNSFKEPIINSLRSVDLDVSELNPERPHGCDVVVVASTPASVEGGTAVEALTDSVLGTGAGSCVVLWGDVDYGVLASAGIRLEPNNQPRQGHQGVGMHQAGFEPVVRLQVGGLAAVNHMDARIDDPAFGLAQRHVRDT